ncbi:MAG TPA: DNA-processing protein DprA [Usitatibacter sp.]|nr:DNA-processing protein DprA [Usitatibacter sp.]
MNAKQQDALPWLRFALAPGLSSRARAKLLLDYRTLPRATAALATRADPRLLERTLAWLDCDRHHVVTLADSAYPKALLQIGDPPCVLYAEGDIALLNAPTVAIVGSRNPSPQGCIDAHEIARALSANGVCIASGMAMGIDAHAHRGALASGGATVAVLGTGIDRAYPRANAALSREIAASGCLLSEFALGMPPLSANFPQRNRLISGLSRAVLVVEAAPKSGSLITAHCANDQGRDVFAMPGSVHSSLSKGCHALIKDGALLAENAQDILRELGIAPAQSITRDRARPASALLDAMGFAPTTLDEIALRSGMAASEAAAQISLHEVEGLVAALPGGRFQRIVRAAPG